jgi:hypothetical protein
VTEDFDEVSLDRLADDVDRNTKDDNLSGDLRSARVKRLKQANKLRTKFYTLAARLAGWTVGTSVVLVIGYVLTSLIHGYKIPSVVAVGFISGLAVETVGVLAIMAGYLFPRDRGADD